MPTIQTHKGKIRPITPKIKIQSEVLSQIMNSFILVVYQNVLERKGAARPQRDPRAGCIMEEGVQPLRSVTTEAATFKKMRGPDPFKGRSHAGASIGSGRGVWPRLFRLPSGERRSDEEERALKPTPPFSPGKGAGASGRGPADARPHCATIRWGRPASAQEPLSHW